MFTFAVHRPFAATTSLTVGELVAQMVSISSVRLKQK
jgi:hypothetical protein